jgi:hypothetical protein
MGEAQRRMAEVQNDAALEAPPRVMTAHRPPAKVPTADTGAGRTVARREACLPDLEPDDRSDGVDSDVLAKDAVRLVPYLDRRFFVQNWLDGKPVHSDEDQVERVNS